MEKIANANYEVKILEILHNSIVLAFNWEPDPVIKLKQLFKRSKLSK